MREAQSGARVAAARLKRRLKGAGTPVQRTCSIKAGEAATGRSGGRRPFRAPRVVEIDTSRRLQGSDFRPAKRVARERNSESQRVYGGRFKSSRDEWKRTVQRAGSIKPSRRGFASNSYKAPREKRRTLPTTFIARSTSAKFERRGAGAFPRPSMSSVYLIR